MASPKTINYRFIELHNLAHNEPGCNEAVITDPLTLDLINQQGGVKTFDLQGKKFSAAGFIVICSDLDVFNILYPGKCDYEHADDPSVAGNSGRVGAIALRKTFRKNSQIIDIFGDLKDCDATDTRPNSCFDNGSAVRRKDVTFGPSKTFDIYTGNGKLEWAQWIVTRTGTYIRDVDPGEWDIENPVTPTKPPTTAPTIKEGKGKGKGGKGKNRNIRR